MQLIIISGRSGSGKSTALHKLEDEGYYCIDNLPVTLLSDLVEELSRSPQAEHQRVAVCIDARNAQRDLQRFDSYYAQIRDRADVTIVYLDANSSVLIKRFSETRRRHPLSSKQVALAEAIERERSLLEPILFNAQLNIDTSGMTLHDLRAAIKERVSGRGSGLCLQLQSFGFKLGIPIDADMVFDLRMLPNPHWDEALRPLTGSDQAVKNFLDAEPEVEEMFQDILQHLQRWLPRIERSNRSYLTVGLGCTGGQHRSVYMAERLGAALGAQYDNIQVRHRELW